MTEKKNNGYYDIRRILKHNADYNLIVGQRSNGKTYGTLSAALTSYLNNGARTAYLRRYNEEITPGNIKGLFDPHPIADLTEGEYNGTVYKSHRFYLARYEEGEINARDDVPFCQTFALNTWERQKGADNGKFDYIVFDEFITRDFYLPNEFVIFCNVLSSLLRDRDGTKIFMLANTVSKHCPYFAEMGLNHSVLDIGEGEIVTTKTKEGLKIALELCAESTNTQKVKKYFSFNNKRLEMITRGKWETKNYPHLTERVTKDNIIVRFWIFYDNHSAVGDLCELNGNIFVHFHEGDPAREYNPNTHYRFSDTPEISPLASNCVYKPVNKAQAVFCDAIRRQKCFYSTNEVGEYIRNWLQHQKQIDRKFFD